MLKISKAKSMALACLFLGILALAVGSTSLIKRSKYIPTEATITRIEEEYDTTEQQYTYSTFAKYKVDGRDYENDIGYYQPEFREGSTIEVRYDPNDPNEVEAASLGFLLYLVILGPILIAAGVIILLRENH